MQGCPRLQCLHIQLADDGDDDVSAAAQLAQLELLVVSGCGTPCPGLATLLRQRGKALSELTLVGVERVPADLPRLCPRLRTLQLLFCGFTDVPLTDSPPLEGLQRLTVLQTPEEETLPAPLLRRCLSSPPLREVSLQHCAALSDPLLEDVLDAGALRLLRVLALESCDEVTCETVRRLVVQCSRLERLSLQRCREISRRDAAELRRDVQKNGWRLTVDWL